MTPDDTLPVELLEAADGLTDELAELSAGTLQVRGEPLLWLGSGNGTRHLLLTWNEGRTEREGPSITLSVWTETSFGKRYANRNAAFHVRVAELPLLARAVATALARARLATRERREWQLQTQADRAGGAR